MACKLGSKDGVTFFQCTIDPLGGPSIEDGKAKPYEDFECMHLKRFENRGVWTCKECGAVYDERTLEWTASYDIK
jgi:hypothetical protein